MIQKFPIKVIHNSCIFLPCGQCSMREILFREETSFLIVNVEEFSLHRSAPSPNYSLYLEGAAIYLSSESEFSSYFSSFGGR